MSLEYVEIADLCLIVYFDMIEKSIDRPIPIVHILFFIELDLALL